MFANPIQYLSVRERYLVLREITTGMVAWASFIG
jgi:hypothetical protein